MYVCLTVYKIVRLIAAQTTVLGHFNRSKLVLNELNERPVLLHTDNYFMCDRILFLMATIFQEKIYNCCSAPDGLWFYTSHLHFF